MKQVPFNDLVRKANELNRSAVKWHFHMLGPACKFSRKKNQYEIIIENEASGELIGSTFKEKPLRETQQMANMVYGADFLSETKDDKKEENSDGPIDDNDIFLKILERARACSAAGTAWHNHHLTPHCIYNTDKSKHCIVFEDETDGDALYAYFDRDPLDALAKLEKFFLRSEKLVGKLVAIPQG